MYSLLFRRETGRRLLALSQQVVENYLDRRFSWIDAYSRPEPDGLRDYVAVLADAVTREAPEQFFEYSAQHLESYLESGIAPIALLATGDLLQDTILELVTPDQREALWDLFAAERQHRQSIVRDWIAATERGA
jgi:hypothetical protein